MNAENQEIPAINPLTALLGLHYEYLQEIAAETVSVLGEEQAGHFTNLANDWMDVLSATSNAYPGDELLGSLVCFYLSGLFKEVNWFQLLFLCGNYHPSTASTTPAPGARYGDGRMLQVAVG
jgi:hypothetical protein